MQETFEIAKLRVNFEAKGELLYTRTRPYLTEKIETPDLTLTLEEEVVRQKHEKFPQLTIDECRYMWMGEAFYRQLLFHDGILMHASCVERDGKAYLFSAKSGTGKSTHTGIWMRHFGDCRMINDDKPAVRRMNGTFYACGTPFSGKDDASENIQVPIRAIVFIERAKENSIEKISAQRAIPLFLSQTLRPPQKEIMQKMLDILGALLEAVPVFLLKCNMENEAAEVSYQGIENYYKQIEKARDTK